MPPSMNMPPNFIGSIRGMRLWASEIDLVRMEDREREREKKVEKDRGRARWFS